MHATPLFDPLLRDRDELANVARRGAAEVDHDVRVDVRDLRVAVTKPFEPALIDQSAGADAFLLLEDRARARMPIEPRVPAAAPTQILLQNSVHRSLIAALELERRREDDVATMMKDGIVVAEVDVGRVDGLP